MNYCKIINDPVFGFINIPSGLILDIVQHPLMQRLTRIHQLGLSSYVYPGAQHSRFAHSIGAYHLMCEAITSLQQKGCFIFDSEAEAVKCAILMHDIGHGPFSHVLEKVLIPGISHEEISILMMEKINRDTGNRLNLAIKIFKDEYHKAFLHELISSQLDMDRLDYLRRDSYYTGVSEANIGSARIIKMLNISNDGLVVENNGLYSIENYLTSRRLMYWQVYLHKTAVAFECILTNCLKRAKELMLQGTPLFCPPALNYFLANDIDSSKFKNDENALANYSKLDDSDILSALKEWIDNKDTILSTLSSNIINRRVFKTETSDHPFPQTYLDDIKSKLSQKYGLNEKDCEYFIHTKVLSQDIYDPIDNKIIIQYKDGTTKDITAASDLLNMEVLSKKMRKYFVCYQRI